MNRCTLLFTIISLLSSCGGTNTTQKDIDPLFGDLPQELVKEIEKIAPEIQSFKINPAQDNSIICDSGTVILIPKNTIVDEKGNFVTGEITFEAKEHFTKADYFLSNLQTVHNDKLLESGGMIYVNAIDKKGNSLKISNGKSIRIEMTARKINSPNIFLGERNQNGQMNWGEMKETSKSLIAYPILYISQHHLPKGCLTECSEFYGIVNTEVSGDNIHYYIKDDILKYEKTLLATKEFKSRYDAYCIPELVRLYIENIDKNLWEIDQMMVDKLYEDSVREVGFYVNDKRTNLTKSQIEAHEWLTNSAKDYFDRILKKFRGFVKEKLEKVDPNLVADTTLFENYINSYESYVNIYNARTAYDATDFGWINLDVIYNDPRAIEMDIEVITNNNPSTVFLIINDRQVMINAKSKQTNKYSFTDHKEGYNKLPKGASGTLVAIGYDQNRIMFGMKDIVIGMNKSENLDLKSVTLNDLKNKLDKLK